MRFLMLWILGFLPLALAMIGNVSDDEELEIANLLKKLNRPYVKSIQCPSGDIVDCVPFHLQSAFDDPLNQNVTYESVRRKIERARLSGNRTSDEKPITQLWHTKGSCPEGTVPIIRMTRERILRARSAANFRRKIGWNHLHSNPANGTTNDLHEYAIRRTQGRFTGTKVHMGVWNPRVERPDEFSLGQIWLYDGFGHADLNTIEAGWQTYPEYYGDTRTRLFGFFTIDSYRTPCYNLDCPNTFVQVSNAIGLGGPFTPVSVYGTSQHMVSFFVYRDEIDGDWWLEVGGDAIGYWPASLFTRLAHGVATHADWGGEVINSAINGVHTRTQMGSGSFSSQTFLKAAAVARIQVVDEHYSFATPRGLTNDVTNHNCYDLRDRTTRDGLAFFYGGPGKNPSCP